MSGEHEEAQHHGIVLFQDIPNGGEIACGLAHLFVVDIEEGGVHPVMCEGLSVGRLGLGDLVLVMGEDQILPSRMNVDLIAQILFAHHRAFDVPARPSVAPGGFPGGLAFLFGLPEHEIQGILLLIFAGNQQGALAALQIVQIFMGELPVLRKAPGPEIDRSVRRHIGVPLFDEGLDHLLHAADFLGGEGMGGGRPDV